MRLAACAIAIAIFCNSVALAAPSAKYLTESHREHAVELLSRYPLIDTHVDLPQVMRVLSRQPLDEIPKLSTGYPGHVDLPKLKAGGVGGVFLTAWAPCLAETETGADFLKPTDLVRDTLESIDLIKEIVRQNPETLRLAHSAADMKANFANNMTSVMIGMEGSHMLGNSLGVMRMYVDLGVKYLTLTHVCHTAFASSNGGGAGTDGSSLAAIHPGNGLTDIGKDLIRELNRLGVMVDLSHVTDQTAIDALQVSQAPVIWSHSGARAIHAHPRNVPDSLLNKIGSGEGKNRGIILSVLYPVFIGPGANIPLVVDHIEHIASVTGRAHVGLASDFDGMDSSVIGMEDASKWPDMIAEFVRRGWSDADIAGLMGGNLLRVMEEVESVGRTLSGQMASSAIYEQRTDLPSVSWGGPNMAYLTEDIQQVVVSQQRKIRDEL